MNTNTVIEHGVLVSSGAVIDHDSYIASGVNIGLGSIVKANCTIAAGVRVEAGDVIFSTRRKIDGVDNRNLEDAIYAFGFGPKCSYVKPFGAGHINETYAVYMRLHAAYMLRLLSLLLPIYRFVLFLLPNKGRQSLRFFPFRPL